MAEWWSKFPVNIFIFCGALDLDKNTSYLMSIDMIVQNEWIKKKEERI